MVNVNEAFQVTYKKGKDKFEVLVDFDSLNEFKKNPEDVSVYDVLADNKIFKDQKKGEIASENLLAEVFKEKSVDDILKEILLNGECQIPTAFLNKIREEKKKQVINYIVENAVNPQTKSKFTPTMVESEVNKSKYNFDPNKDFLFQAEDVIKKLKKSMPISMEKVVIIIKIPAQYCGPFYGPFRKNGKILKEFFDDRNNMHIHMEVSESKIDEIANFVKNHSNSEGEYFIERKA